MLVGNVLYDASVWPKGPARHNFNTSHGFNWRVGRKPGRARQCWPASCILKSSLHIRRALFSTVSGASAQKKKSLAHYQQWPIRVTYSPSCVLLLVEAAHVGSSQIMSKLRDPL